ncbi:hypothetical protein RchiOBHm_Chr4g0393561 [Rosa chinensis]|uniref:Uncharacterized protein n=1 Tax=Rosa chinensis TaxID=74649 RepID=A0A2P6QR06_ROSCH|nr:hypothetical protein RchiOBHm_Chr4g0393561 [Rosa chinensis]
MVSPVFMYVLQGAVMGLVVAGAAYEVTPRVQDSLKRWIISNEEILKSSRNIIRMEENERRRGWL